MLKMFCLRIKDSNKERKYKYEIFETCWFTCLWYDNFKFLSLIEFSNRNFRVQINIFELFFKLKKSGLGLCSFLFQKTIIYVPIYTSGIGLIYLWQDMAILYCKIIFALHIRINNCTILWLSFDHSKIKLLIGENYR